MHVLRTVQGGTVSTINRLWVAEDINYYRIKIIIIIIVIIKASRVAFPYPYSNNKSALVRCVIIRVRHGSLIEGEGV